MSNVATTAVVTPVTLAATNVSETVLAQVLIPQFSNVPVFYPGMTFRITCLCTFAVGGTGGTITFRARIGGLAGQVVGSFVSGSLTVSATGSVILKAHVTLLSAVPGTAANWSGGMEVDGTSTTVTDVINGAGVASPPTQNILVPQFFTVTAQQSSATTSTVMNSAILEQVV